MSARYDYDIIVIGGGAAGLTASGMAASLGAKTALVENVQLGGDCTWTGCVPSKALLRAAKLAHEMRTADRFGFDSVEPAINFRKIIEAVRERREHIYDEADSPQEVRSRNVELIDGRAEFVDAHTIEIQGMEPFRLSSRYFVICAGSSPVIPNAAGSRPEILLTNESLFELEELPRRLAILGGGPVGIEMAQAFSRLGSSVTVIEHQNEILGHDEPQCSALVRKTLQSEGVQFYLGSQLDSVNHDDNGYWLQVSSGETWQSIRCDKLLVAVGRRPNVFSLGLDAAEVDYTEQGITVNHSCQTNVPHIYACGDITDQLHFTHMAENMAKTAITRLLLKVPASFERENVPWVTYTDPESAHLGNTARQLHDEGTNFQTIEFPYSKIDRAVIEREGEGVIILHISPTLGKLYGAHIVGAHAGEMINELALAMKNNLTLRDISNTVHAYPTYLLGVRRAADQWYIRQGSPSILKTLQLLFSYRGKVSDDLGSDTIV